MVQATGFDAWSQVRLQKRNRVLLKLGFSFIVMGLIFRLFGSRSAPFVSDVETPPVVERAESPIRPVDVPSPVAEDFPATENHTYSQGVKKCDLFTGAWVPDQLGPMYTNESCQVIEDHQNCMRNGRPDTAYLYWRWIPRDCEVPKFNAVKFLAMVRNKTFAFVGDSISRNHVQSLLCILSQVEQAVEVYHDEEYRSKRWHFPHHNFTLSVLWSPFLIKAAVFEDINGVSSSEIQLYFDQLDTTWAEKYHSFDYMVMGFGKWFLKTSIYYQNNVIQGCHYCPGKNLTELGFEYAYRKALQLVFNHVTGSGSKKFVILRTNTPDHFEGGAWFSGGTCKRESPYKEGQADISDVESIMRKIELEEFNKAVAVESGVTLRLLDTTHLSMLRPDGHPGPHRKFHPFAEDKNASVQYDCLHWCLPGPIDSWNDLVMELLVRG